MNLSHCTFYLLFVCFSVLWGVDLLSCSPDIRTHLNFTDWRQRSNNFEQLPVYHLLPCHNFLVKAIVLQKLYCVASISDELFNLSLHYKTTFCLRNRCCWLFSLVRHQKIYGWIKSKPPRYCFEWITLKMDGIKQTLFFFWLSSLWLTRHMVLEPSWSNHRSLIMFSIPTYLWWWMKTC